jgi:hypothetical protein
MTDYTDRVEFYLIVNHDDEMMPPCEYKFACRIRQAKHIAYLRPCKACGGGAKYRLCCTQCKEMLLMTQDGVACADCDSITIPARMAYKYFEDISKGARG